MADESRSHRSAEDPGRAPRSEGSRASIARAGHAYTRSMGEAGPYLVIGIQVAAAMLVFTLGGYFADRWLGTAPWLLLLGAVIGMVAVIASVVRLAQMPPPGKRGAAKR